MQLLVQLLQISSENRLDAVVVPPSGDATSKMGNIRAKRERKKKTYPGEEREMDLRHVRRGDFNKRSEERASADPAALPNDGTLAEKSLFSRR